MKVSASSSFNRHPYSIVSTPRGKFAVPASQVQQFFHMNVNTTQSFKAVPAALLNNRGQFSGDIDTGAFGLIKQAYLAISISIAGGAARLAGTPYWFESIEVKSENGGKSLTTIYSDSLYTRLGMYSESQLSGLLKAMNFQEDFHPQDSWPDGYSGTFYLPLDVSVLNELYMKNIRQTIRLVLQPVGDIRVSGSGTVSCTDISIVFVTDHLTPEDEQTHDKLYKSLNFKHAFLEPVQHTFRNTTLTASTRAEIDLSSLNGLSSHLQVMIKPTGVSNTNFGNQRFISLGEGGTVDLLSPGKQSVFGKGTALQDRYIRNILYTTGYTSAMNYKNYFYELNFADSTKQAAQGHLSGCLEFKGQKYYLALTPSSAGTQEVQTLTCSATPDAGRYVLEYLGYKTDGLAFNANAAAIKAALEALPPLRDALNGATTVTVSGAITTNPTITFSNAFDNPNGDLVYVISNLEASGAQLTANTAMTTRGKMGFTSGTYDVFVYAHNYNDLIQTTSGDLIQLASKDVAHQL